VEAYVQGQSRPLPFHPDLLDDYAPQPDQADEAFVSLGYRFRSATDAWQQHHLCHDAYFPLLLGDDAAPLGRPQDSPFYAHIKRLWLPMHEALAAIDVPTDPPEATA